QRKLLERLVFADVARDHFLHLLRLKQNPDAEIIHSGVVLNDRQTARALSPQRVDQVFGYAAEAESAHEYRVAVLDARNRSIGIGHALVHASLLRVERLPWDRGALEADESTSCCEGFCRGRSPRGTPLRDPCPRGGFASNQWLARRGLANARYCPHLSGRYRATLRRDSPRAAPCPASRCPRAS